MGRTINNPWAGLSSYQDPDTSDVQLKFCGRDNESYDVAHLIDNNIFVTLYGKSGTGKTSLLNAGVFPRLRQINYFPVNIRLGMEAVGTSFQKSIISIIERAFSKRGVISVTEIVPMPGDENATEYLWCYFARNRFVSKEGKVLFPVIVFDQFEEVYRGRRRDAESLLRQIYFMMDETHALNDRVIDGKNYSYDFNFRFVVSIREDDLYRLEDSIDNNYLLQMKQCRYRLRSLSEEGALEAVLTPGGDLLQVDVRDKIADAIVNIARNHEDNSISANILSLICSRIFVEYERSNSPHISLSLVDKFVKGNPFEQFYYEATQGFSNKEKSYIETHMVDSTGRRNSIAESDFLLHVKNGALLLDGDRKILQRTSTSSDGMSYRIELIHDSFCESLAGLKEKREKRKKLNAFMFGSIGLIAGIAVGAYMSYQYDKLKLEKAKNLKMESQIIRIQEESMFSAMVSAAKNDSLTISNDSLSKIISERDTAIIKYKKALQEKNEAIREKDEAIREKDEAIREKDEAIREKDEAIREKDEAIREKDEAIREKDRTIDLLLKKTQKDTDDTTPQPNLVEQSSFVVDGIEFRYSTPTKEQIDHWKKEYHNLCSEKIRGNLAGIAVPKDMINMEPCLVYLVLNSKSLSDDKEKQSWFDLYSLMNEEQKYKLYNILYREAYKLAEIEKRYENRIELKYADEYNQKAYEYAKDKDFVKAIETINKAIELLPSEANYYDSKGEILLMEGRKKEAVEMWKKVMELDPDFLSKHPKSNLYKELKKLGLIDSK